VTEGPSPRALVTGASSGIGAAFARGLARRGEKLVLVARRGERLRQLALELGGDVATITLDLTHPTAPAELEAELQGRGFEVDLLVNNAGVGHTGPFSTEPLERALGIVELNVRALVELTRRLLPGMLLRRRGRIVNVVSMAAFQPVPYLAVYAASKAFVLSFSESLICELRGSGVRVQALCPGNIPTEFQKVAGTDQVLFDRTPSMSPEAVVAASLRALDKGSGRVVPGFRERATLALQSVAPRGVVVCIAGELFRPR
jgi:short-subunit dehydrogenase